MGDVVILDVVTTLPIPVDRILDQSKKADMEMAVVVGWNKDGNLYVATSDSSKSEMIYLLEMAKNAILNSP